MFSAIICGKIKADMPPVMRPASDGNGFYFSLFDHVSGDKLFTKITFV